MDKTKPKCTISLGTSYQTHYKRIEINLTFSLSPKRSVVTETKHQGPVPEESQSVTLRFPDKRPEVLWISDMTVLYNTSFVLLPKKK